MEVEIKNKFCDAEIYERPLCDPIPSGIFINYMKDGVQALFAKKSKTHFKIHLTYVYILENYLTKYKIMNVMPNEQFFNELWNKMMTDGEFNGKVYSIFTRKKVARAARKIVNEYFHPAGITKRKVILEVEWQRYERFFQMTKNSQNAVQWFEKNGKVVRAMPVYVNPSGNDSNNGNMLIRTIHRVSDKKLLPITNNSKILLAMLFLRVVGKKGFEDAMDNDVKKFEEYCDQRKLKKKDDYLADVATFFINIHSQGFIAANPFKNVSLKKNAESVRKDFIALEDIEKFRVISTINFNDKTEVRDRLMALLAYDLAMRINEFLSLKVSDFRKDPDGELYVLLRPEIQKGHKEEDVMYFFFDETKELLERYLSKIRNKFSPTTDRLFVSKIGKSLGSQHCRIRFKEICKKLDIKTFYGNSPSPHSLRHSFATLNIEPLGLSLPLYEIMQRLRHTRVETAKRHYIHNNPYLKKQKHNVYRKRTKKKTNTDILNEIPLADVEHWLSDTLHVDRSMIDSIRRNHKKSFSNSGIEKQVNKDTMYIREEEALARLNHLGIPAVALRKYALDQKALADGASGTFKYGDGFVYKEDLINDISRNWVMAKNLRAKLKLPLRTFRRHTKDKGWRVLKIGKSSFIHREDCV